MNINHLGEAVLGEEEAAAGWPPISGHEGPGYRIHLGQDLHHLFPDQFPGLRSLRRGAERSPDQASTVKPRRNFYTRKDGTRVPKFVNLDMEEYRDLEITYAGLYPDAGQEEFKDYSAGIVLQAYLPDAYLIQQQLTEWARKNRSRRRQPHQAADRQRRQHGNGAGGGRPVQLAPGALRQQARCGRQLTSAWSAIYGMQPENIRAVNLGIASHNLFELAYAYQGGQANQVDRIRSISKCSKAWPTMSAAP
jgi:RHH-type proline utilization regulon transcriptional repressor/proline dehydrogenase/delta 1-pyrroline-5-carboxylate dehydrogenase